jgi:hypothetical protein
MKISKIGNKGTKTGEPAIVSLLLYICTYTLPFSLGNITTIKSATLIRVISDGL